MLIFLGLYLIAILPMLQHTRAECDHYYILYEKEIKYEIDYTEYIIRPKMLSDIYNASAENMWFSATEEYNTLNENKNCILELSCNDFMTSSSCIRNDPIPNRHSIDQRLTSATATVTKPTTQSTTTTESSTIKPTTTTQPTTTIESTTAKQTTTQKTTTIEPTSTTQSTTTGERTTTTELTTIDLSTITQPKTTKESTSVTQTTTTQSITTIEPITTTQSTTTIDPTTTTQPKTSTESTTIDSTTTSKQTTPTQPSITELTTYLTIDRATTDKIEMENKKKEQLTIAVIATSAVMGGSLLAYLVKKIWDARKYGSYRIPGGNIDETSV